MFERGPFEKCPKCREPESFGILRAGGESMERRCVSCRFTLNFLLPGVDKKVIYLDQFAISELYKIKSKTRRPNATNEPFWQDFYSLANRAYLLQQVIFPASNIHSDETIVSPFASELGLAHEMMSGDTSFEYAHRISNEHELNYAKAYIDGATPPALSTDVDDILEGKRNIWLPDMHVTADMDYSMFASGIRSSRATAGSSLQALAESWVKNKPTFDDLLKNELESYGSAHRGACVEQATRAQRALEDNDGMAFWNASQSPALEQYRALRSLFEESGVPKDQSDAAVLRFREWPANRELPTHKIFAYLMAAFGWKISSGQRRPIAAGILNDFTAISTYGPYVDAMFVDKECAELLSHGKVRANVHLKAKMFSLHTRNELLEYLTDLSDSAPPAVKAWAREIYGIE